MKLLQSPAWRVFLLVFAAGLIWAATTGQEWEDFYITYRASKNLAEGKGLTYTEGERVHSFTSPLGVLLPATSYLLTGRSSDVGALWIFRGMSLAALGGAAVFMWRTLRQLCPATAAPAALFVALATLDSKTLCFTTSGMETGFMLLFLAWALWTMFTRPPRVAVHLGLAWAGLMWSRPDSCVYIAALAAGLLLFAPGGGRYLATRGPLLREILGAGVICAALYLPWFVWAWSYYGTPVPHTITAKGLFNEVSAASLAKGLLHFPQAIIAGKSSLNATFMPYYGGAPDWPGLGPAMFSLALIPLGLCLLPFVRWEARLASFGYALGHLYLTVVIGFPVPWYIPHIAFLGLVALVLGFGQLLELTARWGRAAGTARPAAGPWIARLGWSVMLAAVLGTTSLMVAMARQAWLEMTIIEGTIRAPIGRWLHDHAASRHDTVFLEPLGFIGYFSGLKMLDYPGLCSPEVVLARRRADSRAYPYCWSELIIGLRPTWLVLRPFEHAEINKHDSMVLQLYEQVKTFDATPAIERARLVPIKGYLEYNGIFEIYHLKQPPQLRIRAYAPILELITVGGLITKESPYPVETAGSGLKAHAPSRLVVPVPAKAAMLIGGFGIYEGAYANPHPAATDGAEFIIEQVAPDGKRTTLLQRLLNPADVPDDRGLQQFDLDLPTPAAGQIVFTVNPGPDNNNSYDWSYWYDLRFGLPPK